MVVHREIQLGNVRIWSFSGHKLSGVPQDADICRMTESDFGVADKALAIAARRSGRTAPSGPKSAYIPNLLRRNFKFYIARDADAVFAVANLRPSGLCPLDTRVEGGTGWTCQLFADKFLASPATQAAFRAGANDVPVPIYLFSGSKWMQCSFHQEVGSGTSSSTKAPALELRWKGIDGAPPRPSSFRCYAGVGTRKLICSAEEMIKALFHSH